MAIYKNNEKVSELYVQDVHIVSDTRLSEFENDLGFVTNDKIPTKVSELINDNNYVNRTDVLQELTDYYNKEEIDDKLEEIQLYKFPNLTIFGEPTINNGQISNFTTSNYAQFPFLVDFRNQSFVINMCFTTGTNVSSQQNIFDSNFGLAFAVRSGKFVIAMSSDGQSWNMGEYVGSHTLSINTTYYVKFSWDRTTYKLEISTDKATYSTDIQVSDTRSLYPKQIIIGKSISNTNTFGGSINLNDCSLIINEQLVWQGMDDAGIATRLATDLSNIDKAGEEKILEIVSPQIPKIWKGTKAQYDMITEKDPDTLYFVIS